MTTAFVIYVVVASFLACSISVYVSIQLYLDLEKLREQDEIKRNVENARLNMFSLGPDPSHKRPASAGLAFRQALSPKKHVI